MKKLEDQLQKACVKWIQYAYPRLLFFAPINEGVRAKVMRNSRGELFSPEGKRAKDMGKRAGVADLVILQPSHTHHGLFVELKTAKGRQSPDQKKFQADVEKVGYKYELCRSFDEFMVCVNSYLKFYNLQDNPKHPTTITETGQISTNTPK